jgi:hypothetical protein
MMQILNIPHPPQMVYINHKIKLTIPSYGGGKHWLWPWQDEQYLGRWKLGVIHNTIDNFSLFL